MGGAICAPLPSRQINGVDTGLGRVYSPYLALPGADSKLHMAILEQVGSGLT